MAQAEDPRRILIIRPSALGDVCRTVPVLVSLKNAYPDAAIDWVVRDEYRQAIEAHPALDRPIGFPRRRFARWWRSPGVAREMLRWFRDLRRRGYELVLDCQGLGRSGLMCLASGAARRVGLRSARELAWMTYNVRVADPQSLHAVDRMMALVEALGIEPEYDMRLHAAEHKQSWWTQFRRGEGFSNRAYAVLAPTARWETKRWPADRFAQLVPALRARGFERVVLLGAPGEEAQVEGIVAAHDEEPDAVIDLVGQTDIGQTMAVIEMAGLVIANDSALLHMAVGFDRPLVGLYGPTVPALVAPYGREESIIRKHEPKPGERIYFKDRSLGDSLMRLIEVKDVLAKIDEVLRADTAHVEASTSGDASG